MDVGSGGRWMGECVLEEQWVRRRHMEEDHCRSGLRRHGPREWAECSSRMVVDKHGGRRKVEK